VFVRHPQDCTGRGTGVCLCDDQRVCSRHKDRRRDTLIGHISDQDTDLVIPKRKDIIEVSTNLPSGENPSAKIKFLMQGQLVREDRHE